jgi:hypothetical protein
MLNRIFLGRFWHWLLLAIATTLLWFCGSKRLHVIEFNWFIIAMLAGTTAMLLAIVRFHREGEQVTRDKLVVQVFDPNEEVSLDRE